MSKHTPAPWHLTENSDGLARGIHGAHGPVLVNIVNWGGISRANSENGQANARLIAAAPDLLEALVAVNDFISGKPDAVEPFGLVRAAIEKATGE